ncbi:MAG: VanZ family protein [Croceitalea sp.]|nr:VanZ family protein [Croceitalea sp.]MBT8237161.1 VanZ family protein [Croceitalea sp.]NNC34654.1 VanZ family protein [Croceitalea sp.]NNL09174.1 VanZ family protein [Croceitalea sp.]NNM17156.1 VanZ family protein [Croceitalea sp.]
MVFITLLSLFSFSDVDTEGIEIPHLDKIIHFVFYVFVVVLGSLFLRERTKGEIQKARALLVMLLFAVFYGMIIEVFQWLLPYERTAEFWDVLANTCGSFVGAMGLNRYFSGPRSLKWKI